MGKKRSLAVLAIVALAALYITTFVLALCDFPGSDKLLAGFLMLDIAVPIMLWIILFLTKHFGAKE